MKKAILIAVVILALAGVLLAVFWGQGMARLKSSGYIPYTPEEAQELAYRNCSQCHNTEKITKYCMRCGPPLVVVVHNMNTLARLERERGRTGLEIMTDAEAKAVAEVWTALVGNWEGMWREDDLVKLLQGDKALIELVKTPKKDRRIESALSGKLAPGAYKEEMGADSKPAM